MVKRLALEKARWVARKKPDSWVLGADTAVVLAGKVFGKPRNRQDAKKMISALQGRSHQVLTGVALVKKGGILVESHCERTNVTFRRLSEVEMNRYVGTREPYDKAGGYAIQGSARGWVRDWRGDYFNVMGLPIRWVVTRLNELRKKDAGPRFDPQ